RNAPMRSCAARTSLIGTTVRSGATRPIRCSNSPAAISSGSIHGVAASFIAILLRAQAAARLLGGERGGGCRRRRRQARQTLLGQQADALLGVAMVEEARAADEDQVPEAADLVVDLHDLAVNGVGVAGDEDAAGDRLLGGDPDQLVGRAAARRGAAPD